MRGSLPIPKDASIEARRTPEGSLYCDVIATALVDMAEGRGSRARRTAETFFFKPDPRCDNQPRADRWCSAIGFDTARSAIATGASCEVRSSKG
jgi:hypothetical protein